MFLFYPYFICVRFYSVNIHHSSFDPIHRIALATRSFTQLQESVNSLITWLDDAETRAVNERDLENSEKLELQEVRLPYSCSKTL